MRFLCPFVSDLFGAEKWYGTCFSFPSGQEAPPKIGGLRHASKLYKMPFLWGVCSYQREVLLSLRCPFPPSSRILVHLSQWPLRGLRSARYVSPGLTTGPAPSRKWRGITPRPKKKVFLASLPCSPGMMKQVQQGPSHRTLLHLCMHEISAFKFRRAPLLRGAAPQATESRVFVLRVAGGAGGGTGWVLSTRYLRTQGCSSVSRSWGRRT